MLQYATLSAFTISELLRENQQGGVKLFPSALPQPTLGLRILIGKLQAQIKPKNLRKV